MILTVMLFLSQLANAKHARIATSKCSHRKLSNKMIKMSKCTDRHVNQYSEELFGGYKDNLDENGKVVDLTMGCRIHNKHFEKTKECYLDLVDTCLPRWVSPWFSKVLDATELNCDCPLTESDPCFLINVQGLMGAAKDLTDHAESVKLDLGEYLLSYIVFDQPCDFSFRLNTTLAQMQPCVISEYEALGQPIYEYIAGRSMDLSGVSPCTAMRNILDQCFGENQCVSGQEMRLVRNVVATIYKRVMETLVQIEDEFGSLANFVTSHVNSTFKWHQHEIHFNNLAQINMSDVYVQRAFEVASHVIADYKNEGCRNKRAAIARFDFRLMVENGTQSNMTQLPNMNATYMTRMPNASMTSQTEESPSTMISIAPETAGPSENMTYTFDEAQGTAKANHTESSGSHQNMYSFLALIATFFINIYL